MCGWKAVAGKTQKGSKWGQETTADVTLLRWNWSSVSNCSYFLRINFGSKMGVTYTKTIYVFKCKRKATQLKNNLTHHCCHGKAFAFEERPLLFSKERSLLSLTVAPIPHPELIMGYWLIHEDDWGTMDSQGHIIMPSWRTLCSGLSAHVRMLHLFV